MRRIATFSLFFVITLSVYAQDIYEVKMEAKNVKYVGALVLDEEGSGVMRVKYYDAKTNQMKMVEQGIQIQNTANGTMVYGQDPVYPGTKVKFEGYLEDNFLIVHDKLGQYSIINVDSNGPADKTSIRKLNDPKEIKTFLLQFNWKIWVEDRPSYNERFSVNKR